MIKLINNGGTATRTPKKVMIIRLRLAKQQLCKYITLFWYISFSLRCTTTTWRRLISRFVEDGNIRQCYSSSFPELRYSPVEFNSRQIFPTFRELKRNRISGTKFKAALIHFSSGRRCRCGCLSSLFTTQQPYHFRLGVQRNMIALAKSSNSILKL